MGLKAAMQALKQAEGLKERVLAAKDLLNDNEAWESQHKLQDLYQQVLLLDLEFALDQKVEQELWGVAFKHFISCLQTVAKDANNLQRNDAQAMLTWFLDAASGFYLSLLHQICSTFHLDLPFRRRDAVYGMATVEKERHAQHSSCMYICQHCLVHLGDIARYRGAQHKQAEAFYRHAMVLAPSSGQPYNQLALLAASRGDQLSTVFHYVRSIAVRHPFPAAATNLERTLKRCADQTVQLEGKSRVSASEFISLTLKLHGLLRCHDNITQAQALVRTMASSLTALIATQALSAWKLVQLLMVHIYLAQDATPQQRTIIIEVVAASLNACLLPAYTLSQQDALLQYFALPAIKLTLQWLVLRPALMLETGFSEKRHIWPSLCQLLNSLHSAVQSFDPETYSEIPLPEDKDLQGFLPLHKFLTHLRFEDTGETPDIAMLRAARLVKLGKKLSETQEGACLLLNQSGNFSAVGQSPHEPADIIRELEELNLNTDNSGGCIMQTASPALSDAGTGSSWGTGKSTPDSGNLQGSAVNFGDLLLLMDPVQKAREEAALSIEKTEVPLSKPQAEKPHTTMWTNNGDAPKVADNTWQTPDWPAATQTRRRQNVAMQAILRSKAEESAAKHEAKQVTFKTPSPSTSPAVLQSSDNSYDGWKSPLGLLLKPGNIVTSQQPTNPFPPQPNNTTIFPNPIQPNFPSNFTETPISGNTIDFSKPPPVILNPKSGNIGSIKIQQNPNNFPQGTTPITLLAQKSGNIVNPPQLNTVASLTTQQNYSHNPNSVASFLSNFPQKSESFSQAPGSFSSQNSNFNPKITPPGANFVPLPNFPTQNQSNLVFQYPSAVENPPLVPSFPPPPVRSELWQQGSGWQNTPAENKPEWTSTKDTRNDDLWGTNKNRPPRFNISSEVTSGAEGKSYSLFSPPPAWCLGQSHSSSTSDKNQSAASVTDNQSAAAVAPPRSQSQLEWNTALPQPAALQSLWSGPSPLERLLQQQRQQREGGT